MGYCEGEIWIPDYEGDEEPYPGYCRGLLPPLPSGVKFTVKILWAPSGAVTWSCYFVNLERTLQKSGIGAISEDIVLEADYESGYIGTNFFDGAGEWAGSLEVPTAFTPINGASYDVDWLRGEIAGLPAEKSEPVIPPPPPPPPPLPAAEFQSLTCNYSRIISLNL